MILPPLNLLNPDELPKNKLKIYMNSTDTFKSLKERLQRIL